jgi:hypothetical protein
MEVTFSCDTFVDFQWTMGCYIPKDSILHNDPFENVKSYKGFSLSIQVLICIEI